MDGPRMLTHDLFAVANLLVKHFYHLRVQDVFCVTLHM